MARQSGPPYILGTVENLTYFKRGDKYFVRKKGGVDAKKLAKAPQFENTRKCMAEFGTSAKGACLLRTAFAQMNYKVPSARAYPNLIKVMMKVLKSDELNEWGQRSLHDGNLDLLKGFNWNDQSKLGDLMALAVTTDIQRCNQSAMITLPSFKPFKALQAPFGATHFRFVGAAVDADFINNKIQVEVAAGPVAPCRSRFPSLVFDFQFPSQTRGAVFLFLGIEFFSKQDKEILLMTDTQYNSLELIDVANY